MFKSFVHRCCSIIVFFTLGWPRSSLGTVSEFPERQSMQAHQILWPTASKERQESQQQPCIYRGSYLSSSKLVVRQYLRKHHASATTLSAGFTLHTSACPWSLPFAFCALWACLKAPLDQTAAAAAVAREVPPTTKQTATLELWRAWCLDLVVLKK